MKRCCLKTLTSALMVYFVLKQSLRYLDPGSGSLITQIVIGAIVTFFTTLFMLRDRILSLLGFKKPVSPKAAEDDGTAKSQR